MTIDISAIEELVTRVDACMPYDRGNVIGFIASGAGEGNSSIARAYVSALALRMRRRVLLLEADGTMRSGQGVMQALADKAPIDRLLRTLPGNVKLGVLGDSGDDSSLWDLVGRNELWKELRTRFDHVVLDLPSADVSRLGLTIAPHCDGVIVLIEAEKSRAPVVASLIAKLHGVRASVIGTVLNKRRFHLPARIYRWL
jgi:Mrp family chromosome partitioning ATPase